MPLTVRDRPPLRLHVSVQTPSNGSYRWGPDEPKAADVPSGLSFSTTMPGGFEQMSCTLPRKPGSDYPDLEEFATVTVQGAGSEVAWQGRLETAPRTSGDQMSITPGAVGWQAHLDDDQSATMIFVDRGLSRWTDPSTARQLSLTGSNFQLNSTQAAPDATSGMPSLIMQITDDWVSPYMPLSETWYDSGAGNRIAKIYYTWSQTGANDGGASWRDFVNLALNADATITVEASANINSAGPVSAYFSPATALRFAFLQHYYSSTPAGAAGGVYVAYWANIAVYGDHGLTGAGSDPVGFLASDVIAYTVKRWAPKLAVEVETSSFVIPQLAFTTPTTASAIISQALQYELMDWWVDEGPTFHLASRANHGRDWRARVGPAGLQETGPQVERMYDAIIVSYNDVTGAARTVGPPGSGADAEDASLQDTDTANPVNVAGLYRPYEMPNIGTSTPAAAIRVGQIQLAAFKAASTAGQAQITGHVQDGSGVWWPAWMIRAGDRIVFTDAHDTTPRRITQTSYDDSSKACQITLDSPPEGVAALLARMSIALAPIGF